MKKISLEDIHLTLDNGSSLWKTTPTAIYIANQPHHTDFELMKKENTLVFVNIKSSKIDKILLDEDVYYSVYPSNYIIKLLNLKTKYMKIIVCYGNRFFYLPYRYISNKRCWVLKFCKSACIQLFKILEPLQDFVRSNVSPPCSYRLFDFSVVESLPLKYLIYLVYHTDISFFHLDNLSKLLCFYHLKSNLQNLFWSYLGNYPIESNTAIFLFQDSTFIYQKEIIEKSIYLKYLKGYQVLDSYRYFQGYQILDVKTEATDLIPFLTKIRKKISIYQIGVYDMDLFCLECGNKGLFSEILGQTYNICKICLNTKILPQEKEHKWSKLLTYEEKWRENGYTDRDIWNMRQRNAYPR